ncbi:MAG: hypothetical protein ACREEP_09550 [Dongiaceae bacterium]
MLGVVTGLTSEAKLLSGLGFACVSTGGRPDAARAGIERLLAAGASGLVSFGIAGALSPDLRTGDVVIGDVVAGGTGEIWQAHRPWVEALLSSSEPVDGNHRQDDVPHHAAARRSEGHAIATPPWVGGGREWEEEGNERPTSSSWQGHVAKTPQLSRHPGLEPGPMVTSSRDGGRMGPGSRGFAAVRDDNGGCIRVGAILGLDRMLSTLQEKADAFAGTGALVIDMESHHVARAAGEYGLPFIVVRAASDQAHESLPAVMATFVDAEGRTKMSAVSAALILGRVSIGELLAAGRASQHAHQALLRCRGALAGLR